MSKTRDIFVQIMNSIIVLIGGCGLFFTSFFWIGSQEQHQELIEASGVYFFLKRFFVNMIFIAMTLGLVMICVKLFAKGTVKEISLRRILLIDLIVLVSLSVILIYLSVH